MEEDIEQRRKYLAQIKDLSSDKLVYIDESGIEMNMSKERGWGRKGKLLSAQESGNFMREQILLLVLKTIK